MGKKSFFDSHCHLTDERFSDDRAEVLDRAREAEIVGIVSIASDAEDAERVVDLVSDPPGPGPELWGTAGIHPHVAGDARPGDLEKVADLAKSESRIVAVGETGLDYHYDNSPRDVQRRSFRKHVELAVDLGLPVVVHTRDADEDTAALIRDVGSEVRGVLHCFTGGTDLLEEGLAAGWHVSFSGIASFPSFRAHEQVRLVPRDRLLVETDSPYLAPHPHRGGRNEPSYVVEVAGAVAEIRGEERDEVGAYTTRNARAFYGLTGTESP
ncbi:MAG: TatD family hydrolase [Longimicrobiales bacterium]|nr:TatD family hydrolase [Longimicrobiales bacterium]